ncbi:MAG: hypothetical protein KAJ75_01715 [Alphaproteobacteria bacterium]|nr:hypothetical protein [Alphaproteobacteria bacterium]
MESGNFEKVSEEQFPKLLERINDLHHRPFFNKESYLETRPVSFYRDYKLLKATSYSGMFPVSMQFFYNSNDIVKVNGDRATFEEMSKKADVHLTKYNVVTYAKIFLGSLMTDGGSFQIVQSLEDVKFTGDITEELLKELPDLIKTAKITKADDGFMLDASMFYDNNLYDAEIFIGKHGELDIKEEKLIRENIPTREIYLR